MLILSIIIELSLYALIILLFKYKTPCVSDEKVKKGISIAYSQETRQVIINDKFVVTSFRNASLNRCLFEYLYENPGRKISFEELDKEIFKGRTVTLAKVGDAMGFKSELRKLLFTVEGDFITFHPEKLENFSGILKLT